MSLDTCRATLSDNTLVLENNRIRRRFLWNDGLLVSRRIEDLQAHRAWDLVSDKPDCCLPGQGAPKDGRMQVVPCPATAIVPEHLEVHCTVRLGSLELRRTFRIYPDCPAIACDYYLRGRPAVDWQGAAVSDARLANIEGEQAARQGKLEAPVLERLATTRRHLKLTAVQFFDVTDRRNNLTATRTILPYRQETRLAGNLLFIRDLLSPAGLFVLKEAPCSDMQLAWPGCDFVSSIVETQVVGLGVSPVDLRPDEWTRCYGVVMGAAGADEYSLLTALRTYQSNLRITKAGRDHGIMLNTWGDRSAMAKIGEAFCLAELEAGSRLGVSHFQIDDGWQLGEVTKINGVTLRPHIPGRFDPGYDSRQFWTINPERFPRGLSPVAARARELEIELCLWCAPNARDSYRLWREEADVLIDLHRRHGIRTFKIDSVEIPDKTADVRFHAMLDRINDAAGGQAVFNLDATAGQRFGYHYLTRYGVIFLENRYTDWSNYYPHWTLRNLWTLSRHVPAQGLQIEFLNRWRNADKYPADDPLAPCRVPFDYCFAITMMAQPLAWFEASCLPEEAFAIAPLVRTYRQHQQRIHGGQVLPIGAEPDGTGWTGFQSLREDGGYLLVFRELNRQGSASLQLWNLAGRTIRCRSLGGQGQDFTTAVDPDGSVTFHLPSPFTFALYEYLVTP